MLLLVSALIGCGPAEPEACSELTRILVFTDADGDGFGDPASEQSACEITPTTTPTGGDCDDGDAGSFPDAAEQCDAADNDCDGAIDEEMPLKIWYSDYDGDGVGNADYPVEACAQPNGTALEPGDCNDDNAAVSPFGREVCNGVDDDCDGRVDDEDPSVDPDSWATFHDDADGDGFGDPAAPVAACAAPPGAVGNTGDCDDTSPRISPDAEEICNGEDDDCDGLWEESDPDIALGDLATWWYDGDGDGTGDAATWALACAAPLFYVANDEDCDDGEPLLASPAPWLLDSDADGVGAGAPSAAACTAPAADWVVAAAGVDCAPSDPLTFPGATDPCGDDADQDCNGFDAFCTVDIAETCAESEVQPHATTGVWPVSAALAVDDLDVGAGVCTPAASNGREGFVQVDLDPLQVLTVTHTSDADASAYVLGDCTAPATCEGGADNESADGTTETLRWANATLAPISVWAVFDCADGGCDTADGTIQVDSQPLLADTCAEAETWTPLETGSVSLYGSVGGYTNDLSLGGGMCTGDVTAGNEGFLPVRLGPGETVEIDYTQTAANAAVYLLTDCQLPASCEAGRDAGGNGATEHLVWTNSDAFEVTVYATLDCVTAACSEFGATITVF